MDVESGAGRVLLGRYRLGPELGRGAHGVVYRADDLGRGGEHVALKLLRDVVGGGFAPAAGHVAAFRHPTWASVLDAGRCGEHDWFQVTRFVDGVSLDRLRGPQEPNLVWRLLEDGARVLDAFHRQGLIHYDVTPANWLLEHGEDRVRFVLTDGGLANLGPVTGVARGTPLYMAPELTEEGGHDHRVDLYSLGLVAFRLLTGADPFEGGAGEVLGERRRREAPRPSRLRPDVPTELDDLLASLLARDPSRRPEDGRALLARVARALDRDLPLCRPLEVYEAAGGGILVGRKEALERFRTTCATLSTLLPGPSEAQSPSPAAPLEDPVLVLRGAQGTGASRTSRAMAEAARHFEVPALLLAGRDGAPDPQAPLQGLLHGLAALAEGPLHPSPLPSRRSPAPENAEERVHYQHQLTERFLQLATGAAKRTPFVLVVEDYPDLPDLAREAMGVLSRYLLARTEHGHGANPPPIMLVIDAGPADTEPLTISDVERPERPVLDLEPLTPDEVDGFCSARFPGLALGPAERHELHAVSEGRPATLVTLLAAAAQRGDLRPQLGSWQWDLSAIRDYPLDRQLTPVHADALEASSESLIELLEHLALAESFLPETIVAALWQRLSTAPLPPSPLLIARDIADRTFYSLPNHAVRAALLDRLTEARRSTRTHALLRALAAEPRPETLLDRARLHLEAGQPQAALDALTEGAPRMSIHERLRIQPLLRNIVETAPDTLTDAALLSQVTDLLEHGPDATWVALAACKPHVLRSLPLPSALRLAQVLDAAQQHNHALLLLTLDRGTSLPHAQELLRHTLAARLSLKLRDSKTAHAQLAAGAAVLARIGAARPDDLSTLGVYWNTRAQLLYLSDDIKASLDCIRTARTYALAARNRRLLSNVLNNLGIALVDTGHWTLARRAFEKSRRMKQRLGNIPGALSTAYNVARLHAQHGELVQSTVLATACVDLAQRHNLLDTQVRTLRLLSEVHDRQYRPAAALTTIFRAWRLAERHSLGSLLESLAWPVTTLAAALGRLDLLDQVLRHVARFAKLRARPSSRARYHLIGAGIALHCGAYSRTALCVGRARRHAPSLTAAELGHLAVLHLIASAGLTDAWSKDTAGVRRPLAHEPHRLLYRSCIYLQRLARGPWLRKPPPFFLRGPSDSVARSVPGTALRLTAEVLLRAALVPPLGLPTVALQWLRAYLVTTSQACLETRMLALAAQSTGPTASDSAALTFSQAIATFARVTVGKYHLTSLMPDLLRDHIARSTAARDNRHHPDIDLLHATAHRSMCSSTYTQAPDTRLHSALRRVLDAAAHMRAHGTPQDLLKGITQHAIEITDARRACVVLIDPNDTLRIQASATASAADHELRLQDLSHTLIRRVLSSKTPVLLHDIYDDAELMARPSIASLSLRSALCVPISARDELLGLLYADSAAATAAFDRIDLEVLSLFAEQAAGVIQTSRLLDDLRTSYEQVKVAQERLVRGERLRVMGELSSAVAHEFNNLLTSILARVQMMTLTALPQEIAGDLRLVEKAALDAAEVVRRLQDFTRRERQARFADVSMQSICKDAIDLLQPLWRRRAAKQQRPIEVQMRVDGALHVRGDATELREVVTNLLKNAIDACENGGQILIAASEREGRLRLEVRDTGHGMNTRVQQRVFDPFFTTKGVRGTGLGLCLTQQILERHGGGISLESQVGAGTTAVVELPLIKSTARGAADMARPVSTGRATRIRVLLVDDDETVLQSLAQFLEKRGHAVTAAQSAEGGLRALQAKDFDVVLTDIGMPGMDGVSLCRRIREMKPAIPVVLMSGWASEVDPQRVRQAGARALLAKPFSMHQVTEVLATLTELPRSSRSESGS